MMLFNGLSARSRDRRSLASAFIGEIAAAMDTVEGHAEIRRLELAKSGTIEPPLDFSDFQLPPLAVYEANVSHFALFNPPLPRELSYFYTRLAALPVRLQTLKSLTHLSAEDTMQKIQDASEDVNRTMKLGENLLRSIKVFVSRKQPDSISRA